MKLQGRRQSANVEQPFQSAAQAVSASMPGVKPSLPSMPQRSPFDILAERMKADENARALGMGDVSAKMDTAAKHDALATKMSHRTRWNGPNPNDALLPSQRKGAR